MPRAEAVDHTSLPLYKQAVGVAISLLPAPFPLLGTLDRQVPLPVKQLIAELPLNRVFAKAIADGDFDGFEGRVIRFEITGEGPGISLGFWRSRLRVVEGPGEATIRGSIAAFRQLAERQQDPDRLFFQRQLTIEGDTELGLALKNLLDSLEWTLSPPALRSLRGSCSLKNLSTLWTPVSSGGSSRPDCLPPSLQEL